MYEVYTIAITLLYKIDFFPVNFKTFFFFKQIVPVNLYWCYKVLVCRIRDQAILMIWFCFSPIISCFVVLIVQRSAPKREAPLRAIS